VDDLNFLKRGGRISSAAALLGSTLNIKPILHVDDSGHLTPTGKVRGRKNSVKRLLDEMQKTGQDLSGQEIFISHGDCIEDAVYLADLIREKYAPKNIVIGNVGPVIGAHSGPGTLALFFLGSVR
jgi:DegV family protein with EDD domain